MTNYPGERRSFSRAKLELPVQVHQGGSVWHQKLVDISVAGIATDQPDVWDAQYNELFTLVVQLDDSKKLELHAYLQHVEAGRLGFSVQHVDPSKIEALRKLLVAHVDDPLGLDAEIKKLDD